MRFTRLSQLKANATIEDYEFVKWLPDNGCTPPMMVVEAEKVTERKPEAKKWYDPNQIRMFDEE